MKGWLIGPLGRNIIFQLYILWLVVGATSKWLKFQIQKLLGYEFHYFVHSWLTHTNFDWRVSKGKLRTFEKIFPTSYYMIQSKFIWYVFPLVLMATNQIVNFICNFSFDNNLNFKFPNTLTNIFSKSHGKRNINWFERKLTWI
jgi:hypothetical protein